MRHYVMRTPFLEGSKTVPATAWKDDFSDDSAKFAAAMLNAPQVRRKMNPAHHFMSDTLISLVAFMLDAGHI